MLIARLPELAGSVLIAEIVHHVLMAWDLYDPDTDTFASWDEFRLAASRLPIPCLPAHFIRAFSLLRLQVLKLRLGDYALRLARDISSPRLIFSVHIANG